MTVNDIINGSESGEFPGLIPIVESYLDSVNVDVSTRCHLSTYLDLISKRASGELDTTARWIRNFIDVHPNYKHDSVVSDEINHDLIGAVIAIGERETAGRDFAGLGIHGLERLLNGFRGGCGGSSNGNGDSSKTPNGNSHAAETEAFNGSLKRKSDWIDGQEVIAS
jgi:glutamate--cysteine ligase catalytic subunit